MAESMHHRSTAADVVARVELDVRLIPFAIGAAGLEVALWRRSDGRQAAALPAGALRADESLDDSANRIAFDALNTPPDYVEQLYTFSNPGSRARVTVAYSAILSADTRDAVSPVAPVWFASVDDLPDLNDIDRVVLDYATLRLRAKLGYSNIGFYFLPREFTLSDLQDVYESVIGASLDKRNFRRRILAAGIVESVGVKRPTSHRPATLYRFAGGDPALGALTPVSMIGAESS